MKAKIKVSELRKISKATGLDLDELKNGAYWFNRGDSARVCFTRAEYNALAMYFLTREVETSDSIWGTSQDARALCMYVDDFLGVTFGTTLALARSESARSGRWLVAELNMGLNHITLSAANPYASRSLSFSC